MVLLLLIRVYDVSKISLILGECCEACLVLCCAGTTSVCSFDTSGTSREKMILFMIAWHTRSIFLFGRNLSMVSRENKSTMTKISPVVHAVEVYPVTLSREKKFLLGSRIKVYIQLFPSSVCPDAFSVGDAYCFNGGVHPWPIIERV